MFCLLDLYCYCLIQIGFMLVGECVHPAYSSLSMIMLRFTVRGCLGFGFDTVMLSFFLDI